MIAYLLSNENHWNNWFGKLKGKASEENRFKNAFVSSMIVTLKEKNMQVIPFFTLSTHGDDSKNILYLGQFENNFNFEKPIHQECPFSNSI